MTNSDDLIGTFTVSFDRLMTAFIDNNTTFLSFTEGLYNNGRHCGELSGKISIDGPLPTTLRVAAVHDSSTSKSGGGRRGSAFVLRSLHESEKEQDGTGGGCCRIG